MPVYLDANPAVLAVWPYQLENGALRDQVEAKDLAAQFERVQLADGFAYRLTVRPGDRYRDSTGYRILCRALSGNADRGEGDVDAFLLDFEFPAGSVLPSAGWILLAEGHGAAYAVADWRLTIRPGWKLMLSFNTGTLNAAGAGTGWTPERQVATLEPGRRYVMELLIRWDPDNGEGYLSIHLDDFGPEPPREIVPADLQTHGTAQETASGVYVEPYVLVGLYTGSDLSAPLSLLIHRFVYADTREEIRAYLAPPPPPVEEPPAPAPVYVTRAELDQALEAFKAAQLDAGAQRDSAIAALTARLSKAEGRLTAIHAAAVATKTAAFSKALIPRWPL